ALRRAFAVGDRATGVPVLTELYERMRAAPVDPDLPGLWRQLGVQGEGREVSFDPAAPLNGILRAIGTLPAQPAL
nr:hypothetical protein [Pseudomonadota bacterium]